MQSHCPSMHCSLILFKCLYQNTGQGLSLHWNILLKLPLVKVLVIGPPICPRDDVCSIYPLVWSSHCSWGEWSRPQTPSYHLLSWTPPTSGISVSVWVGSSRSRQKLSWNHKCRWSIGEKSLWKETGGSKVHQPATNYCPLRLGLCAIISLSHCRGHSEKSITSAPKLRWIWKSWQLSAAN